MFVNKRNVAIKMLNARKDPGYRLYALKKKRGTNCTFLLSCLLVNFENFLIILQINNILLIYEPTFPRSSTLNVVKIRYLYNKLANFSLTKSH